MDYIARAVDVGFGNTKFVSIGVKDSLYANVRDFQLCSWIQSRSGEACP